MNLGLGFKVGNMFVKILKRFTRSFMSFLKICWPWEDVGGRLWVGVCSLSILVFVHS
jgi:hypothetical protein